MSGRTEAWLMQTLGLIRDEAYYAGRIDWPEEMRTAEAFAATRPGYAAMGAHVSAVLAKLDDQHSFLLHPSRVGDVLAPASSGPDPIGRRLPDGVGYVWLPGFSGGARRDGGRYVPDETAAVTRYAAIVRDVLADPTRCGWVLDLRDNTGGNVYPMLTAVAPLLGAGTLVGFQHRDRHVEGVTVDRGGQAVEATGDVRLGAAPPQPWTLDAPVAVLINSRVASAAEIVVIAFTGRDDTRTFGSDTAGVPTENHAIELSDGSVLVVTAALGVDRNAHIFDGPIPPDEPIEQTADRTAGDVTLLTATTWITQHHACQPP